MLSLVPLTAYLIAAVAFGALIASGSLYLKGRSDGYAKAIAERQLLTTEALQDAIKADEAARRCASDPACRLSNDGYRRD